MKMHRVFIVVGIVFFVIALSPSMACECIVSGETKFATIEFGGETHCYSFFAEAGQGVVIQMADLSIGMVIDRHEPPEEPFDLVEAMLGLEPRVQLFDPFGIRIADSGWDWSRSDIDNCSLEKTGIYTIVVSDEDATDGGWRELGPDTGDYGLSLVVTGGTTTSLQDRDGGDITVGRAVNGTVTPGGDLDAYSFFGQPGQGVVINMTDLSASADLEPRVRLYDPNGVLVADSGWDWSHARIENYQLKMTGIYTVVASDADATWRLGGREYTYDTGEYGLAVAVMPPKDPYGLYPYAPQPSDGNSVSLCDWDTLSWWSVTGATRYDVLFYVGPCMTPGVGQTIFITPLENAPQNVTRMHVPMPVLDANEVYYWQVVAHTTTGDIIKGPVWWFSTEPCPFPSCGLTLSAIGRGSITDPGVGVFPYSCGQVVPVTAVADLDYEFVRWEGSTVDANKTVVEYQDPFGSKIWVTVDGAYTLRAIFEEVINDFPLDSNPGWTMNGQWEFGTPTGDGCENGNPDPTSGHTGQNVIGVNLNGCYDIAIGGPYSVVAGPFNMRNYGDVNLRFWEWLNTDWSDYVKNSLEISLDGGTWVLVWQNPERMDITDSSWNLVEYDISLFSDGQPSVYLRWTYQVLRERAYPYTGWNIDDIQLIGRR